MVVLSESKILFGCVDDPALGASRILDGIVLALKESTTPANVLERWRALCALTACLRLVASAAGRLSLADAPPTAKSTPRPSEPRLPADTTTDMALPELATYWVQYMLQRAFELAQRPEFVPPPDDLPPSVRAALVSYGALAELPRLGTTVHVRVPPTGGSASGTDVRGIVRFAGKTDFELGLWLGLELLDGAGTSDERRACRRAWKRGWQGV